MRNVFAGFVLCALACVPAFAHSACRLQAGDRVVLYGAADDPDVLVWDSRFRLRDYHAASFDEARQLVAHAYVVTQGTRALVVTCVAGFVQSQSIGTSDAVGVKIEEGKDRGRFGWVVGTDVRPAPARTPER